MLAILLLLLQVPAAAGLGRPTLAVDLPSYLATADLVWRWNATASGSGSPDPLAPVRWWQAAYVGNGLLGVMVTCAPDAQGATPSLRLDVGRTDLWQGQQRQPIGYLHVTPRAAPLAAVAMRLALHTATLHVNLTLISGSVVAFSLAVNAADPAGPTGVAWLEAPAGGGGQSPLLLAWTPDTSGKHANTTVASGSATGTPWGSPTQWWTQGGDRSAQGDGGTYTTALTSFTSASGSQVAVLAVASDQRTAATWASQPAALAAVAAGVAAAPQGLAAAHQAWWAGFWAGTSFFSFDSAGQPLVTALETFAHIQGYRYASSSRFSLHDLMGPFGPGGPGPLGTTDCVGPWCQNVWDMNAQVMLYLPVPSNRGVLLALPALAMYASALNGTWTATYGSNAPGGGVNTLWWLANMHRYAAAHGDDALALGVLLPGLRAELSRSGLQNGTADGLLHVHGCSSPEYPMRPATDCSYHLAILQWAARAALALARAGAPSDPALPLYADIAARLAPLPTDPATGSWEVAAGLPFAVPHRHYSHLLAAHDLGLPAAPGTLAAGLDVWWSITCAGPQAHGPDYNGDDECRGFTQAAMAAMSTRLNRTQAALGNLTGYLRLVGLPNAMYGEEVYAGHPDELSPVAESAYSAAASVYGMLLGGGSGSGSDSPLFGNGSVAAPLRVTVWPAAPWRNASFFRLRAPRGALLVSAQRQGGATAWVGCEAELSAGGGGGGAAVSVLLEVPDWAGVAALAVAATQAGGGVSAARVQPGLWLLSGLQRGEAASVYPAGAAQPDFAVREAAGRNASEFNFWGSNFVFKGELAR